MAGSKTRQDEQAVAPNGQPASTATIAGVRIVELSNVFTRSGWLSEIFRADWAGVEGAPQQINWVELSPNRVTDWHRHAQQTDHLVGVGGVIKLALCDGRPDSPTYRATEVIRIGALRPVMVIIPPGVWHGLRNESGQSAGFLAMVTRLFDHQHPDTSQLAPGDVEIPDIL
jgi:dTDP-4-dehydrorhamnose 3,5-epimerase